MQVAVSIAPLASFAREIAGDHADVHLLVPPGASPHTYQLRPDQMKLLSKASVLVLNGVGLEYWATKAIDAADNPDLIVVKTADGVDILQSGEDHNHQSGNPHVWLSPLCAMHQASAIRDAFIQADPEHANEYRANADAYQKRLSQLDQDIRRSIQQFSSRQFVAFHSAWVYFARDYGLVQAAVVESVPGKEPAPSEIRDVVNTIRQLNAKAIFAEPQLSDKAAQVIADETDAQVLHLDPLGQPPDYDYIDTMRRNVEEMARALK